MTQSIISLLFMVKNVFVKIISLYSRSTADRTGTIIVFFFFYLFDCIGCLCPVYRITRAIQRHHHRSSPTATESCPRFVERIIYIIFYISALRRCAFNRAWIRYAGLLYTRNGYRFSAPAVCSPPNAIAGTYNEPWQT